MEHSLFRPLVFNQSATNTQSFPLNSSKFVSAMICQPTWNQRDSQHEIKASNQIPHPLWVAIKCPPSWAGRGVKCPGYAQGGMFKLRFDWNITFQFFCNDTSYGRSMSRMILFSINVLLVSTHPTSAVVFQFELEYLPFPVSALYVLQGVWILFLRLKCKETYLVSALCNHPCKLMQSSLSELATCRNWKHEIILLLRHEDLVKTWT